MARKVNMHRCVGVVLMLSGLGCALPTSVASKSTKPIATSTTATPAPGTAIGPQFYKTHAPAYRPGMKWEYAMTASDPAFPSSMGEMSTEIVAVSEGTMTLKSKLAGQTVTQTVSTTGNPMDWNSQAGKPPAGIEFKAEGTEDVTVPAGRYEGAAKIRAAMNGMTVTGWYHPEVGLVKSESTVVVEGKSLTLSMVLKRFGEASGEQGPTVAIDDAFFATHAPPLNAGVKRRFAITGHQMLTKRDGSTATEDQHEEQALETLRVSGDRYIVRQTSSTDTRASVFTMGASDNPLVGWRLSDYGDYSFEDGGQESVTVPAGTYATARRITFDRGGFFGGEKITAWLAPDVGLVKAELSNGGETEMGRLEQTMTFELTTFEVPSSAGAPSVAAPAFPQGARLTIDGVEVPLRPAFGVEDISKDTDIVFIRGGRPPQGSASYNLDVQLLGASKTADGFSLDPTKATIGEIRASRWPATGPFESYMAMSPKLTLTGVGDKLTGKLEFDAFAYGAASGAKPGHWVFEFDLFDRRVQR